MVSVFIGFHIPPEFSSGAAWHDYRDQVDTKTKEFGWPESEACGPFSDGDVRVGFSLCYELSGDIDQIHDNMIKLKCEFPIEGVTVDV